MITPTFGPAVITGVQRHADRVLILALDEKMSAKDLVYTLHANHERNTVVS